MDRGGEGIAFRINMGLGNPQAMDSEKRLPNFNYYTLLAIEMKICKEYLQKPHSYFKSLPKIEQLKLRLYEEWERKRSIAEEKKMKIERNISQTRDSIK